MYHKVVRAEVKSIDEARGEVEAVVSSERPDRSGDIIRQGSWELRNFKKHPVLLAGHDYRLLTSQIGEWKNVRIEGKELVGTAVYYTGQGNEQADWGFQMAMKGKAAFSVGFIPDMAKAQRVRPRYKEGEEAAASGGWEFNGQELLEISQVTIPANPQALQRLYEATMEPEVADIVEEMLHDAEELDVKTLSDQDTDDLVERIADRLEVRVTPLIRDALKDIFAIDNRLDGIALGVFDQRDEGKTAEKTASEWDARLWLRSGDVVELYRNLKGGHNA